MNRHPRGPRIAREAVAVMLAAALASGCLTKPMAPGPTPSSTRPPASSTGIQPDLACAVPQEEFDVMAVVDRQLGAEASARLKRLLDTDFKTSDLTPEDRRVLRFLARETLWIPALVERWLGDAMFRAVQSSLEPIDDGLESVQKFANDNLAEIVRVSPATPFEINQTVLQNGTPSGMVGGRVFMDLATVRDAMTEPAGSARRDKLAFIYAHELAHVYKRHKAKHLQERLLSIDDARKLVRALVAPRTGTASMIALLSTLTGMNAIVTALRTTNSDFLRSQEVEADACAASLMVTYRLGDPLRGFDTYSKERGAASVQWTVYDEHPPDASRRAVIEFVVKSASRPSLQREDVRSSLLKHTAEAAKRDVDFMIGRDPKGGVKAP